MKNNKSNFKKAVCHVVLLLAASVAHAAPIVVHDKTLWADSQIYSNFDRGNSVFAQDDQLVFTADASGGLSVFEVDWNNKTVSLIDRAVEGLDGSKGLHRVGNLVASENGKYVYVTSIPGQGLPSMLVVYEYDAENRSLRFKQEIKVGQDVPYIQLSFGDPKLSPDGLHLYVLSGIGGFNGSMHVFAVDPDNGHLSLQQVFRIDLGSNLGLPVPIGGPVEIAITPDGSQAYILQRDLQSPLSFRIVGYDRDSVTGVLTQNAIEYYEESLFNDRQELRFTSDGSRLHVIDNRNQLVFSRDLGTGELQLLANNSDSTIPSLPDEDEVKTIRFSQDGLTMFHHGSNAQWIHDVDSVTGVITLRQSIPRTGGAVDALHVLSDTEFALVTFKQFGMDIEVFEDSDSNGLFDLVSVFDLLTSTGNRRYREIVSHPFLDNLYVFGDSLVAVLRRNETTTDFHVADVFPQFLSYPNPGSTLFTADGLAMYAIESELTVFSVDPDGLIDIRFRVNNDTESPSSFSSGKLVLSPDETYLFEVPEPSVFSNTRMRKFSVWGLDRKPKFRERINLGLINELVFSADGQFAYTAESDIKLWRYKASDGTFSKPQVVPMGVGSNPEIGEIHKLLVTGDGKFLIALGDRAALFRLLDGSGVPRFIRIIDAPVSDDGQVLVPRNVIELEEENGLFLVYGGKEQQFDDHTGLETLARTYYLNSDTGETSLIQEVASNDIAARNFQSFIRYGGQRDISVSLALSPDRKQLFVTSNGDGVAGINQFSVNSWADFQYLDIGDRTVAEDEAISIDLDDHFTDPNGGIVTFNVTGLPPGLRFDNENRIVGAVKIGLRNDQRQFEVEIFATNSGHLAEKRVFTIDVTTGNAAPKVLAQIPDLVFYEDAGKSYFADMDKVATNLFTTCLMCYFVDSIDDTLTFEYTGFPGEKFTNSAGGTIGFVAREADVAGSPYFASVIATDSANNVSQLDFQVTVLERNDRHEYSGLRSFNSAVDELFSINLSRFIVDEEGNTMRYTSANLPAFLALDPDTGILSGTPSQSDMDQGVLRSFGLSIEDDTGQIIVENFSIRIRPLGTGMISVIDPAPHYIVNEDDPFSQDLNAWFTDSQGEMLTFSALPGNALWTIDENGILTGTFDDVFANLGTGAISITATNESGISANLQVTYEVANSNDLPMQVLAMQDLVINEGDWTVVDLRTHFTDDDNEALAFTVSGMPAEVFDLRSIGHPLFTLGILGREEDVGTGPHTVTVTATDGAGESATGTFQVTVLPTENSPEFWLLCPDFSCERFLPDRLPGQSFRTFAPGDTIVRDLDDYFIDPDPLDTLTFTLPSLPDAWTFDPATNVLTGNFGVEDIDFSSYRLFVTATDTTGRSYEYFRDYVVRDGPFRPHQLLEIPTFVMVEGSEIDVDLGQYFSFGLIEHGTTFNPLCGGFRIQGIGLPRGLFIEGEKPNVCQTSEGGVHLRGAVEKGQSTLSPISSTLFLTGITQTGTSGELTVPIDFVVLDRTERKFSVRGILRKITDLNFEGADDFGVTFFHRPSKNYYLQIRDGTTGSTLYSLNTKENRILDYSVLASYAGSAAADAVILKKNGKRHYLYSRDLHTGKLLKSVNLGRGISAVNMLTVADVDLNNVDEIAVFFRDSRRRPQLLVVDPLTGFRMVKEIIGSRGEVTALANIGDTNANNSDDVIGLFSNDANESFVQLRDTMTGVELWTSGVGTATDNPLGVVNINDLNGDGVQDFAVLMEDLPGTRFVTLMSGIDGVALLQLDNLKNTLKNVHSVEDTDADLDPEIVLFDERAEVGFVVQYDADVVSDERQTNVGTVGKLAELIVTGDINGDGIDDGLTLIESEGSYYVNVIDLTSQTVIDTYQVR